MDSKNNDNNLAIYHPQEKGLVNGYLRQQQQIYFTNKHVHCNLHAVGVVILLYSAGLITIRIAPTTNSKADSFAGFEWSFYPSCSIKDLKNQIVSQIPANEQISYAHKSLCYQKQELVSFKTVSDYKITHLATLHWKNKVVVKVGMLGDSQIGKTELMAKYIEDKYDEDYIETLGVNFMEKTFELKNVNVTISIWDLGGQKEFAMSMPLVCSDAKVIIFAFDLTQKQSLFSVKRWYKEARKENKIFMPFLVGTRYHLFSELKDDDKKDVTKQARKFAKKMHAPLVYCSSEHSINVKKIFKIIIAKVFDLKSKIREVHNELKEAIIEFDLERKYNDIDDEKEQKKKDNNMKKDKKTKDNEKRKKKKKKQNNE
eukprot:235369_1